MQILALFCTFFFLCRPGFAHKVRIFAWQDGNRIMTESKFSRGRAATGATVSVFDPETGKNLLSGTTDNDGLFSFPIPATTARELRIVVDGGDGHKNSWDYLMDQSATEDDSQPASPPPATEVAAAQNTPLEKGALRVDALLSKQELTGIIEESLDKKLAPIRRSLAESAEAGPTLQDILGGLGYILGLAGMAAYVQSRKKERSR